MGPTNCVGRFLPTQQIPAIRHRGQCLGVDGRLCPHQLQRSADGRLGVAGGKTAAIAASVWSAAVRGSTLRTNSARLSATRTPPSTGTTMLASASCGLFLKRLPPRLRRRGRPRPQRRLRQHRYSLRRRPCSPRRPSHQELRRHRHLLHLRSRPPTRPYRQPKNMRSSRETAFRNARTAPL